MRFFLTFLFISLFISSCSETSPDDFEEMQNDPQPQVVTYDGSIKEIMQNSCVNCHQNAAPSGGLRLETYDQVRNSTENGTLIDRITRQPGDPLLMPQGTNGLPQSSIDLVLRWRDGGFIEN